MAAVRSNWADRPGSDPALSSDDEDFVSSHSTASLEPNNSLGMHCLSTPLSKVHLDQPAASSHSSEDSSTTPTSTSLTAPVIYDATVLKPSKPLKLLDLPLDILKVIVKEITHTNDLASLALTCSALHSLAIPNMYSRFDIVWPESLNPSTEEDSGVDALSYGLSTLVMGEDIFQQLPPPRLNSTHAKACSKCGSSDDDYQNSNRRDVLSKGARSRRGNYYAQYTRTFSIGNGPLSWVEEYSVNREVGKMLGTLVALAVARMINLEAFIWDMPTGVVREIWLALASLADRPGHECRLERIWVRWHDNSENVLRIAPASEAASNLFRRYKHVEYPSFSVLPPLKSVAVLDIDEPSYVEELAELIEKSRHCLVELRIGVASKAHLTDWIVCAKDSDTTGAKPSWPRPGGLLSILSKSGPQMKKENVISPISSPKDTTSTEKQKNDPLRNEKESESSPEEKEKQMTPDAVKEIHDPQSAASHNTLTKPHPLISALQASEDKLKLEVLELERIPLSISTLLPTIDWTRLRTLTLICCDDHEHLWRALRRKYAPPATPIKRLANGDRSRGSFNAADYSLRIKHLRTDNVTPFLMLFIKDALAPNTLESVFFHESVAHESNVQIETIYKHILRRHRLSLRKVLIDASDRHDGTDNMSNKWKKWIFNPDMIAFVTSGRMPQLRELGMAIRYQDWHYFLQRLPNIPQLRALYLPHISHNIQVNLKEFALQVLDIVSIRPDLKMTYIGLQMKCYQIIEEDRHEKLPVYGDQNTNDITGEGDNLSDFDEMSAQEDDNNLPSYTDNESDLLNSDLDDGDDYDEAEDDSAGRVQFRLQEIHYYDDKISIFKARHGVL